MSGRFVPTDPDGFELRADGGDVELHCMRCVPGGVQVDWWAPGVHLHLVLSTVRSHNAVMHPSTAGEVQSNG
jgi:hypothetical protein